MNTTTESAPSATVVLEETAADAVGAQVDTAEDPSVEATTCFEADFLLAGVSDVASDLFGTLRQVVHAVRQVAMAGSDAQTQKATTILADARRSIYRLLAEDES